MNAGARFLRGLATGLACALGLVLGGCQPKGARLAVYSAGPRPLAEKLCRSYTEATGVPVELFTATTGQILSKLEAERFNPRADVVILASQVGAEALKQAGRLRRVELAGLDKPAWHDPDGYYHAMAGAMIGVAVRADGPAPAGGRWDWDDFLEGRYPGRICLPSPTRSGASGDFVLAYLLARPAAWSEFRQARRLGLDIAGANAQAITSLLTGACQAVVGAVDYVVLREIERGEPLRMYYPESGGVRVTRPVAVLAGTRHPAEAEAFVRHCLGPAMQREAARLHFLPVRDDVPVGKLRAQAAAGREFPFDAQAALGAQAPLMRRFQYEIERAVVVPE